MKNTILIKQHACIQLGHLYEHLYVRQVNNLLYGHGIYKSIDYDMWGVTYDHSGIIEVTYRPYTKRARRRIADIINLHVEFGENNDEVSRAMESIVAEEMRLPVISSKQSVLRELRLLDSQDWQRIEDVATIANVVRRKGTPLRLDFGSEPRIRKVHATLELDQTFSSKRPDLAPLFNLVGRILLFTSSDQVAMKQGMFVGYIGGSHRPLSVDNELWMLNQGRSAPTISEEVIDQVRGIFDKILTSGTVEAIANDIQITSYSEAAELAPDTERLYDQTHVYIGERGWKNLATRENIESILENTTYKLNIGRTRRELKLHI